MDNCRLVKFIDWFEVCTPQDPQQGSVWGLMLYGLKCSGYENLSYDFFKDKYTCKGTWVPIKWDIDEIRKPLLCVVHRPK
jgi:hypothetical protein